MKRPAQQPRFMLLAIATALGFAMIGAGCSPNHNDATNAPANVPAMPSSGGNGVADSAQPVTDTWITTKVKSKLLTVRGLDNSDLHVETNNGVVTLSGHADSQAGIDAAVAATRSIKGVKRVDTSRLTVAPGTGQ